MISSEVQLGNPREQTRCEMNNMDTEIVSVIVGTSESSSMGVLYLGEISSISQETQQSSGELWGEARNKLHC